jgi:DNA-binding GntR family transcriptional regulator
MPQRIVLSIGEQIYRTIREKIIDNEYSPGEILSIDKLAEEFGVSTTPVREVLFRLEGAGLVAITRNRGATVSPINPDTAHEVWEFRRLLESYAARFAATRCDIGRIVDVERKILVLLENVGDFELYKETDRLLHRLLYENMGNRLIRESLDTLSDHARRIRYFAESLPFREEVIERVSREHLKIIEALKRRDAGASEAAVFEHLEHAEERTLDALARSSCSGAVDE